MTTNDYLEQLKQDKTDLVSNLTYQGIENLTGDETFTELVPKVLDITTGSAGRDWTEIGYTEEPQVIDDGFNYAKNIYDNWDSTRTSLNSEFQNDLNLLFMPAIDTLNVINFGSVFQGCKKLLYIPQLNTSNGTRFSTAFNNCTSLTTIPQLDMSNGTTFYAMFSGCSELTTIPQLDTSNGEDFQSMFGSCSKLTTIPQLNASKSNNVYSMFNGCSSLTTFGGLLNLGQAFSTTHSANYYSDTLSFDASDSLTHESLMNVINKLYDIATKGCKTQKLQLGSTNLAKLTAEEIAIATNKGWTVS